MPNGNRRGARVWENGGRQGTNKEGKGCGSMEVRLQSGKLILVETDRLGEIGKLRGFLTEEEMEQLEEAAAGAYRGGVRKEGTA